MKITIKGRGQIFRITDVEDEHLCEYNIIFSDIQVFANDEDITKKKGKYIKDKVFTKDIDKYIGDSSDPSSFIAKISDRGDFDFETNFELPIEESEFDPKKLQLIKSDYEFDEIPYCIMSDVIIYDGKEYRTDDDTIDYWTDFHEIEYYG